MRNLSELSLKKSLTREELRDIKGEGSNCYCLHQGSGTGFYLGRPCSSDIYPAGASCFDA